MADKDIASRIESLGLCPIETTRLMAREQKIVHSQSLSQTTSFLSLKDLGYGQRMRALNELRQGYTSHQVQESMKFFSPSSINCSGRHMRRSHRAEGPYGESTLVEEV